MLGDTLMYFVIFVIASRTLMMYILDSCTKVDVYIYRLYVEIIYSEMYGDCDSWCVRNRKFLI